MASELMNLRICLPFQIFAQILDVTRIIVETHEGSYGLLPHRLDGVAALAPGILTYETKGAGEAYLAVDEGVMVKTGFEVLVSVRRAIGGGDLHELRALVEKEFLTLDDQEQNVRATIAKLEAGLMRQFAAFKKN